MSNFLDIITEHGYTAEQGAAAGCYLCTLHLLGYLVESEQDAESKMHKITIFKVNHGHIERIGDAQQHNMADALLGGLHAVREYLGAEEFTRQLHALSPGAFPDDN